MKRFFYTCMLFFFVLIIHAQESKNTETETLEITSSTDDNIRQIFQKIAQGNRQSISSLRQKITLEKTVSWSLEGRTGNGYKGQVKIRAKNQSSNLEYREFPIEESLIPDFMICEVWDKTSPQKKPLHTFKALSRKSGNIYEGAFKFVNVSMAKQLKLTLKNIEPRYNSAIASEVEKRLNQIDKYYKETESLERFQHILDRLEVRNLEEFEENGNKLTRIKRKIRETECLKAELDLTENDPARLLPAFRKLKVTYEVLAEKYEEIEDKRHILYYENGMDLLQRGRTSEAVRMLESAVRQEPNYAPAQLALARLELRKGNLDDSRDKIRNLRQLRNADTQTQREIRLFYGDVYDRYLQRAKQQQNRQNYDRAFQDYREAQEIARFLDDSRYEREVERKIRTLRNDQFTENIQEIQTELRRYSPNLQQAFRDLEQAERFQNDNRQYIDNEQVLRQTYGQVYQKSLTQIEDYLRRQTQIAQFRDEIAECLDMAERSCPKSNLSVNCRTDLERIEGKIKTTEAEVMVGEAEQLMNQQDYRMAHKMLWSVEDYIKNNQNHIQASNLTTRSWKRYFIYNFLTINNLIEEKNYTRAISDLEYFVSDLDKLPHVNLQSTVDVIASEAYTGKYNEGLAEVKRKIQAKSYPSAYQWLRDIETFERRHKKYISKLKPTEIRQNYIMIFKGFLSGAKVDITSQNFESALSTIRLAEKILSYQPAQKQTLQNLKFQALFGMGQEAEQQKNYEKALQNYVQAQEITSLNTIPNAKESHQNVKNAVQKNVFAWVSENIEQATQKINPDQLEEAEKLANQNTTLLEKYNLVLSGNLSKKQDKLWKDIRAEKCRIAGLAFDKSIETAQNQITQQDFAQALETLQNGISTAKNHATCGLNTSKAEKLVQKYADAGTYQKMIRTAQNDLEKSTNQIFTQNYLKAERYFEANKVQKFGLAHTDFKKFVLENGRNDLYHFLAVRYASDDLKFTKMLLNKLAFAGYGKHSLRKLGREMAEKDFVKYANSNPKKIVEKYKFSKDAFRQFRKGYLETWKR